jgi:pimeloyl-ACP methyl ester carboxylesterase
MEMMADTQTTMIDGISTRFEVTGSGPALLMYSPGGFDSSLENWKTFGNYRYLNLVEHLSQRYTCITFDRRESGRSGGRVERIDWGSYVRQGVGLLDHLGIEKAHLMGGCVGCSSVASLAIAHPDRARSMVLFSPAGGVEYRIKQHARLAQHLVFVANNGLAAVVELANSHDLSFTQDPQVGPWVTVIRTDPAFATHYTSLDIARYLVIVEGLRRTMFDRDTVPGPEPEDLMVLDIPALIVPGQDSSHAPSAARYLEECLPRAEFWDIPVAEQTEETVPPRILEFLESV